MSHIISTLEEVTETEKGLPCNGQFVEGFNHSVSRNNIKLGRWVVTSKRLYLATYYEDHYKWVAPYQIQQQTDGDWELSKAKEFKGFMYEHTKDGTKQPDIEFVKTFKTLTEATQFAATQLRQQRNCTKPITPYEELELTEVKSKEQKATRREREKEEAKLKAAAAEREKNGASIFHKLFGKNWGR